MEHTLLTQLQQRPLLCDGAMGSLLYARGITYEKCFDALNLSQPELISSIHREYINAGAQIIETNSFGANRAKLEAYNLEGQVRDINRSAVRLAREAREVSGQPVFVAGAVGPTGRPLQAADEHRLSELRAIFREQVEAVLEGGADLLILETFSSLAELRQAVLAAQEAGGAATIGPVWFFGRGANPSWQTPRPGGAEHKQPCVNLMGGNSRGGPAATFDALQEMITQIKQQQNDRTPLFSAQPNAGLPTRVD